MKYGVDVTSSRLDDLDKRLLTDVSLRVTHEEMATVLDVGCGQGGLSVALAKVGATVVALDRDDYLHCIETRLKEKPELSVSVQFIHDDISTMDLSTIGHFDMVVMQRVLHYLPYQTAKNILSILRQCTDRLYLSVTGVQTEIGHHYTQAEVAIDKRWDYLDVVGQELFSITAPICLYYEIEVRELLRETGWKIEWSRISDFGNIKVAATKQ